MNQAQKRAHWTAVIEQQKQSQLSIKQFCQANGIPYQTFCYWSKRLHSTDTKQTLQPIVFNEQPHSSAEAVVLFFANGIRAELPKRSLADDMSGLMPWNVDLSDV